MSIVWLDSARDCTLTYARTVHRESPLPIGGLAFPPSPFQNQFVVPTILIAALLLSGAHAVENSPPQTKNSAKAIISIPAGTILPIRLPSLSSQKNKKGDLIKARVMQDVPLPNGEKIRAGAIILGRILDVTPATPGNQAALILTFDTLIDHGKKIPITTSLRALASPFEIDSAQIPDMGAGESDVYDWLPTTQIGGETAYGLGGPVARGDTIVGRVVGDGVLVNVSAKPGTNCRGSLDGNSAPQALWLFSSDACGVYGFPHLAVRHAGRSSPLGQIILTSDEGPVDIGSGSGILLRVLPAAP